jgi:hypothetical protein
MYTGRNIHTVVEYLRNYLCMHVAVLTHLTVAVPQRRPPASSISSKNGLRGKKKKKERGGIWNSISSPIRSTPGPTLRNPEKSGAVARVPT